MIWFLAAAMRITNQITNPVQVNNLPTSGNERDHTVKDLAFLNCFFCFSAAACLKDKQTATEEGYCGNSRICVNFRSASDSGQCV